MKLSGFAIHLFTGLGALCALFSVEAVMTADWPRVFFWLGVAFLFLIDGIDGPIARAVRVKDELPRFSGERIDLVIDYLTYVFVPVLALLAAGRLPEVLAYPLAALILLSSLFHFSDLESKATDLAFVGFPAIWNILAFYVFALDIGPAVSAVGILAAAAATFVPLHWVHPVRVTVLRPVTLVATGLWAIAAVMAVYSGFPASLPVQMILIGVAIYGMGITVWLSLALSSKGEGS